MSKKIVFFFAVICILFFAGLAVYAFLLPKGAVINQPEAKPANNSAKISADDQRHPYVGDDFTFFPPSGWIQTNLPGTLVAYQNSKETQPKNSAAEKIHFKSYIAVSFDNTEATDISLIKDLVKNQTSSIVPNITFTSEKDGKIDGYPAKLMEADVFMQDVDFKIFLVIILKGDKYYTISGNTTAQKWPEYKDAFYNVADSLKFK